jgi:small subunit ribosomal protein S11
MAEAKTKKKAKKSVSTGMVFVQSTFNNTIITLTDEAGEVLGQGKSKRCGFKGAKRSTLHYAATPKQLQN